MASRQVSRPQLAVGDGQPTGRDVQERLGVQARVAHDARQALEVVGAGAARVHHRRDPATEAHVVDVYAGPPPLTPSRRPCGATATSNVSAGIYLGDL